MYWYCQKYKYSGEKVLEFPNSANCLLKFCSKPLMTVLQMFFGLCCINIIWKNEDSDGVEVFYLALKSMGFENVWEAWVITKC